MSDVPTSPDLTDPADIVREGLEAAREPGYGPEYWAEKIAALDALVSQRDRAEKEALAMKMAAMYAEQREAEAVAQRDQLHEALTAIAVQAESCASFTPTGDWSHVAAAARRALSSGRAASSGGRTE